MNTAANQAEVTQRSPFAARQGEPTRAAPPSGPAAPPWAAAAGPGARPEPEKVARLMAHWACDEIRPSAPPAPAAGDDAARACTGCGAPLTAAGSCGQCGHSDGEALIRQVLQAEGQPLDSGVASELGQALGHELSGVRIHTDADSSRAAQAVDADAFTVGQHIVFAPGRYDPHSAPGRELLRHELVHTIQQRGLATDAATALPLGAFDSAHEREAEHGSAASHIAVPTIQRRPAGPGAWQPCTSKDPAGCPTYELWLRSFASLPVFESADSVATQDGKAKHDSHMVLGDRAAERESEDRTKLGPPEVNAQVADHFIDHPTDAWVRQNLPDELRMAAYQLPADCADVAFILRHVWLYYQGRTERYGTWTIGRGAGKTEAVRKTAINGLIGKIASHNVSEIVAPYQDEGGKSMLSFAALEPVLHPGDIIVWAHFKGKPSDKSARRSGGHSQTVESIARAAERIQSINLLQGNQPLGPESAADIMTERGSQQPGKAELRAAPGRRIERATLSGDDLQDVDNIWTVVHGDDAFSRVVSAGPSSSAARPQVKHGKERNLGAWIVSVETAPSFEELEAILELALREARADIESKHKDRVEPRAAELGQAAGQRLWTLAKQAKGFGNQSHFEPLHRIRAMIRALGGMGPMSSVGPDPQTEQNNPNSAEVSRIFAAIDDAFHLAARGASDVTFEREPKGAKSQLKILLTGFDPFTAQPTPPGAEVWNPSGAAILALDGQTLPAGGKSTAAIEGVILPVSTEDFEGSGQTSGIVERVLQPHANDVDAIITISQGIHQNHAIHLEPYAVGVHQCPEQSVHRLAAEEPAISLSEISSSASTQPNKKAGAILKEDRIDFDKLAGKSADTGMEVSRSLTLDVAGQRETITDEKRLQQIFSTMQRVDTDGTRIRFKDISGDEREAQIIEGAGGSYLSNEVSYRTRRMLHEIGGKNAPVSFHVHTELAQELPTETETAAGKEGQKTQTELRSRLITSLTKLILKIGPQLEALRNKK